MSEWGKAWRWAEDDLRTNTPEAEECSVDECIRPPYADGMCKRHQDLATYRLAVEADVLLREARKQRTRRLELEYELATRSRR
jgi:hypothetical protein